MIARPHAEDGDAIGRDTGVPAGIPRHSRNNEQLCPLVDKAGGPNRGVRVGATGALGSDCFLHFGLAIMTRASLTRGGLEPYRRYPFRFDYPGIRWKGMKTKAPRKPSPKGRKRKPSEKEQYERFRQAARELGTDESEEAFERAFKRVVSVDAQTPRTRVPSNRSKNTRVSKK